MNGWMKIEIPKRHSHCALCGSALTGGIEIYSLLLEEVSSEALMRKDFCLACWKARPVEEKEKVKGYWKSYLELKKTEEKDSKVSRAFSLLQELLQAPEEKEQEIFILALFLSHARQLILRQEFKEEGISYHLYEVPRQGKFLTVKVPVLSSLDIENLQCFLFQ